MFVCTEETLKKGKCAWGQEVQRLLAERGMTQNELADRLRESGIKVPGREFITELLYGVGYGMNRRKAVSIINRILEIPEEL